MERCTQRNLAGTLAGLWALLLTSSPAFGLIFYSTGELDHNTIAPSGAYTDSGFQWQGAWGIGAGTPISSKHFITSNHYHVGGTSPKFYYNGVGYDVEMTWEDDAGSDLRIVEIKGNFTSWAALYTQSDEVGKESVIHGRGMTRGTPVTIGPVTHGWEWSTDGTGTMRWGTNVITGTAHLGKCLVGNFDADSSTEEAMLADKDSGAGLFIADGGVWKLAGVNYYVNGPYDNDSDHSTTFDAAMFDEGGFLEYMGGTSWTYNFDGGQDIPGTFVVTRISDRVGWIHDIIPELALALGDMDGSGEVNNNDIIPFVLALIDRDAYFAQYGLEADIVGDIDGSGALNNNDINAFVNLLTGAGASPGELSVLTVPEPAALVLLGLGSVVLLLRRPRKL